MERKKCLVNKPTSFVTPLTMPKFILARRTDDEQPFDPRAYFGTVNIRPKHLVQFGPIWQVNMEIGEAKRFNRAKFPIRATPSLGAHGSENLPLLLE